MNTELVPGRKPCMFVFLRPSFGVCGPLKLMLCQTASPESGTILLLRAALILREGQRLKKTQTHNSQDRDTGYGSCRQGSRVQRRKKDRWERKSKKGGKVEE